MEDVQNFWSSTLGLGIRWIVFIPCIYVTLPIIEIVLRSVCLITLGTGQRIVILGFLLGGIAFVPAIFAISLVMYQTLVSICPRKRVGLILVSGFYLLPWGFLSIFYIFGLFSEHGFGWFAVLNTLVSLGLATVFAVATFEGFNNPSTP